MGNTSNRRRHYRIRYPVAMRPVLLIGDQCWEVTELSEGGMRVEAEVLPNRDGIVCGILRGVSGRETEVAVRILRKESGEITLNQMKGVSFAFVLEEQRRLLKRYPAIALTGTV